MKNYVSEGTVVTVAAPSGGVVSGQGVVVGSIFGVAVESAAATVDVAVQVEGVFDLAKDSSVFSQGSKVFATTSGIATLTTTQLGPIGYATIAALTGDATVRTRLAENPIPNA